MIMFGQEHKTGEKQVDTDLNRVVTPMLDMTFQILFFLPSRSSAIPNFVTPNSCVSWTSCAK